MHKSSASLGHSLTIHTYVYTHTHIHLCIRVASASLGHSTMFHNWLSTESLRLLTAKVFRSLHEAELSNMGQQHNRSNTDAGQNMKTMLNTAQVKGETLLKILHAGNVYGQNMGLHQLKPRIKQTLCYHHRLEPGQ